MDKFKTQNFSIVKIDGFYRLKFIGKKLPAWNVLYKKIRRINLGGDYDLLYKYIIRNNKICYIHARSNRRMPQMLLTDDGKVISIRNTFTKIYIRKTTRLFNKLKRILKTKKYKELPAKIKEEQEKEYLAFICLLHDPCECIKYIIDKCRKLKFQTIIIPLIIHYDMTGYSHHNLLLIKGNKAWRVEHIYNHIPEVNTYLAKQFKKIGIDFQGYIHNVGNQTLCDYELCMWWSMYVVFYYSINKRVGFDDIFYKSSGVDIFEKMKYQMHIFLAYILELLKKIKKEKK